MNTIIIGAFRNVPYNVEDMQYLLFKSYQYNYPRTIASHEMLNRFSESKQYPLKERDIVHEIFGGYTYISGFPSIPYLVTNDIKQDRIRYAEALAYWFISNHPYHLFLKFNLNDFAWGKIYPFIDNIHIFDKIPRLRIIPF